jgi:hypothetical protein
MPPRRRRSKIPIRCILASSGGVIDGLLLASKDYRGGEDEHDRSMFMRRRGITSPRTRCKSCGTHLLAGVPGYSVRGVNGELLPQGTFNPEFHGQCQYATAGIQDDLPHYRAIPARFGGSDELMQW